MLKDCMEIFEKRLEKYRGDTDRDEISFITDSYVLADGTYLLMDIETGKILKTLEVDKNTDKSSESYKEFAQKDYSSRLIDMNKSIDSSKQIHSNNYLSFFMKKEAIVSKKLKEENFDKYYDVLKNPLLKHSKNCDKELYLSFENKNGKPNEELILKCKNNIQKFLFTNAGTNKKYWENEGYLKIFFNESLDSYKIESDRHVFVKIYNKNDDNVKDEDNQIFGLPNNNMALDDKKPFIKNRNRKVSIPCYMSQNGVFRQKLFFDFLFNLVSDGIYHLYITNDDCVDFTTSEDETKNKTVILTPTKIIFCRNMLDISNGYYLHILKKTECEIHDFAQIAKIDRDIDCKIEDIVDISLNPNYNKKKTKLTYDSVESRYDLFENINKIFYSKPHYSQKALDDWYYKGQDKNIKRNIEKYCDEIIKNTILCGDPKRYFEPYEQYNLKFTLVNYFNNKELKMSGKVKKIIESLDEKINSDKELYIETSDEFYFAIGQLINYFNSLKKADKKTHVITKPFLKSKSIEGLKKELLKLFKKYSYSENLYGKRFNNLFKVVVEDYETEDSIDFNMIIGGYLSQSLIYKKNED